MDFLKLIKISSLVINAIICQRVPFSLCYIPLTLHAAAII